MNSDPFYVYIQHEYYSDGTFLQKIFTDGFNIGNWTVQNGTYTISNESYEIQFFSEDDDGNLNTTIWSGPIEFDLVNNTILSDLELEIEGNQYVFNLLFEKQ